MHLLPPSPCVMHRPWERRRAKQRVTPYAHKCTHRSTQDHVITSTMCRRKGGEDSWLGPKQAFLIHHQARGFFGGLSNCPAWQSRGREFHRLPPGALGLQLPPVQKTLGSREQHGCLMTIIKADAQLEEAPLPSFTPASSSSCSPFTCQGGGGHTTHQRPPLGSPSSRTFFLQFQHSPGALQKGFAGGGASCVSCSPRSPLPWKGESREQVRGVRPFA